ncbi:DUF6461 domain-containing protein [Streptomyces sp. NPDC057697]|uniref:DUF6461 domain-containing protein n=1 Tax=Streptomyces sp. NPDC057697 TaxID=3346219 RepID=UPI00369483C3
MPCPDGAPPLLTFASSRLQKCATPLPWRCDHARQSALRRHERQQRRCFFWAEDAESQLHFGLRDAGSRSGTRAADLREVIRHLGFACPEEPVASGDYLAVPAAFALAEHLTGIRVPPASTRDTTFICGTAEIR